MRLVLLPLFFFSMPGPILVDGVAHAHACQTSHHLLLRERRTSARRTISRRGHNMGDRVMFAYLDAASAGEVMARYEADGLSELCAVVRMARGWSFRLANAARISTQIKVLAGG